MSDDNEVMNNDEDIEDTSSDDSSRIYDVGSDSLNESSSIESSLTSDSDNDRISIIEESKAGTSAGILFNFFNLFHL